MKQEIGSVGMLGNHRVVRPRTKSGLDVLIVWTYQYVMGIFHFGESSSNLRSGTKSGALRAQKRSTESLGERDSDGERLRDWTRGRLNGCEWRVGTVWGVGYS